MPARSASSRDSVNTSSNWSTTSRTRRLPPTGRAVAGEEVERPRVGREVVDRAWPSHAATRSAGRRLLAGQGEGERLERMRRRRHRVDRQSVAFWARIAGTMPARASELLPLPDAPTTAEEPSGARASRPAGGQRLATEEQPCVALVEEFEALERGLTGGRWLVTGATVRRGGKSVGRPSARTWYISNGRRTSFSR